MRASKPITEHHVVSPLEAGLAGSGRLRLCGRPLEAGAGGARSALQHALGPPTSRAGLDPGSRAKAPSSPIRVTTEPKRGGPGRPREGVGRWRKPRRRERAPGSPWGRWRSRPGPTGRCASTPPGTRTPRSTGYCWRRRRSRESACASPTVCRCSTATWPCPSCWRSPSTRCGCWARTNHREPPNSPSPRLFPPLAA